MSAPYFHVIARLGAQQQPIGIFFDLSERDLKADFVKPYRRGTKIAVHGNIFDTKEITKVNIIETLLKKEPALEELQRKSDEADERFNRNSKSFFVVGSQKRDDDIVHCGEDVTSKYITGAPGEASMIKEFVSNPWVVTIGGVLITAILAYFGLG